MGMFDKRLTVTEINIDENGRNLGDRQMFLELRKNEIGVLAVATLKTVEEYAVDPSTAEIVTFNQADAVNKSVMGRAVVGGVLLGPLGAVVGGLSGTGKKDAWFVEIKIGDNVKLYRMKNDSERQTLEKWLKKH